jgi:hypothetical protein
MFVDVRPQDECEGAYPTREADFFMPGYADRDGRNLARCLRAQKYPRHRW